LRVETCQCVQTFNLLEEEEGYELQPMQGAHQSLCQTLVHTDPHGMRCDSPSDDQKQNKKKVQPRNQSCCRLIVMYEGIRQMAICGVTPKRAIYTN
jgi:hypothetical protein